MATPAAAVPFTFTPSWRIPGQITDVRELKGTKDGKVWAHVVQIMAMGGMFELMTKDAKLAGSVGAGQQVIATGRFEQGQQGSVRLFVQEFSELK